MSYVALVFWLGFFIGIAVKPFCQALKDFYTWATSDLKEKP